MNYGLAYRVGFHPWEDAADQRSFVDKLSQLLAEEEAGREPPYGRALDVGTGSAVWAVWLARRGWQVTGVDIVEKALQRARGRAAQAGVEVQLVHADVTALTRAGLSGGYRLILDTGTFHGLGAEQRMAMGREIDAAAASDATVLLLAWRPRWRGPLPRGVSFQDIERSFPGWTATEVGDSDFKVPPLVELLFKPAERWYRLRRRASSA
jgi:SAM-dependent methyltransferase